MSQEVQAGAVSLGPSLHEDRAVERARLEAGADGCLSKQPPAMRKQASIIRPSRSRPRDRGRSASHRWPTYAADRLRDGLKGAVFLRERAVGHRSGIGRASVGHRLVIGWSSVSFRSSPMILTVGVLLKQKSILHY